MDTRTVQPFNGRVTFLTLLFVSFVVVNSQDSNSYGSRDYNRDGVFVPPVVPGYQTYVYKDRRYGYQRNYLDPIYRGPPHLPEDRRRFEEETGPQHPELPGILGSWRPDLQGRERPDSKKFESGRDVFVTTNYGRVQGFKVLLYDQPEARHRPWNLPVEKVTGSVNVFLGIPYAKPPTFSGRFKPPRAHNGWQLMQAVDWGPACPQPSNYTGATKGIRDVDEDCLYLNIFTPPNEEASLLKSVMFYIHGGDFIHGASNLFPGHMLAAFHDVIVVSINYRLGALGFLSTADENSPGNYGLLDQAMALKWVYENIKFFNGNPDSITLFGPGAGAASAGLLMVAPRTSHMVAKVIAQSGSPLADWALIIDRYRAQNTSRVYGERLGCSIENSWKLVSCLKDGRSSFDLGNSELQPQVGMFPWGPVFDRDFIVPGDNMYEEWRWTDWHFFSELPEDTIKKIDFRNNFAYMAGVTTQEASYIISNNETLRKNQYRFDADMFDQKIRELVLRYNYTINPEGVYQAIKYMYTYWPDPKNETLIRDQYINMLSDFLYVAPFDKLAKLLVDKKIPVYLYVLNTTIEALNLDHWRRVPHDTEHFWLTGAPFMDPEFFPENLKIQRDMWTDNDRNMSYFFMQAYSNFAKYGKPTPSQIRGLYFDEAKPGYLKYLNINTTFNSSILFNYRQTESAFWSQYLPTVIGRLVPIYPPLHLYWWEPKEPLQIAFWSVSTACLLLIVLSTVCCMLWRNSKRQSDLYYSGDILMVRDDDHSEGIENITRASKENMFEYRDTPPMKGRIPRQNDTKLQERLAQNRKFSSTPSLRSGSNVSLKDMRSEGFVTSSPNGQPRMGRASSQSTLTKAKSRTHVVQGVPQTAV